MITSTANQQVKNLVQLRKKAKARREQGVFLVEGLKMFLEAPKDQVKQIFVSQSFLEKHEEAVAGRTYEILSDHVFEYVSDTRTPQGILCAVRQPAYSMEDLMGKGAPCVLVLEGIQDPGNLGTMFRSGEGAGITGIIMDDATADIFNPKTIRSTMGSIYRVPFIQTSSLKEAVEKLKDAGVCVYAAHLMGTGSYDEANYTGGCAFLIGNEGNGLTEETADLADVRIRIPMEGKLESLNAAVAASILMYEVNRQRRKQDVSIMGKSI